MLAESYFGIARQDKAIAIEAKEVELDSTNSDNSLRLAVWQAWVGGIPTTKQPAVE
jgi:hypothetical protein